MPGWQLLLPPRQPALEAPVGSAWHSCLRHHSPMLAWLPSLEEGSCSAANPLLLAMVVAAWVYTPLVSSTHTQRRLFPSFLAASPSVP